MSPVQLLYFPFANTVGLYVHLALQNTVFCSPDSHKSQSKPGTKMAHPEPCKKNLKAATAISGWDPPLLTLIYPGFDCDSHGTSRYLDCRFKAPHHPFLRNHVGGVNLFLAPCHSAQTTIIPNPEIYEERTKHFTWP